MMVWKFIFAQIVIFVFIILVLKHILFNDTNSAISRITKLDNMNREKERVLNQKLIDADKFFDERKKAIDEEEKKIQQEAHRSGRQLHDDTLKKAKDEAGEIIKKANAAHEKIRNDARTEAESKIIDFSRDILERSLTKVAQNNMHETLIQEFMIQVEESDLGKVSRDIQKVVVVLARPTQEETKNIIKRILDNRIGRSVEIEFKEDPLLVAGMAVEFGSMIVDGSLAQSMKDVAETLKNELMWKKVL